MAKGTGRGDLVGILKEAAKDVCIPRESSKRFREISQTSKELIEQRDGATTKGEEKRITKLIRKEARQDRNTSVIEPISKDLGVRDLWLGCKSLKKDYTPMVYCRRDEKGRRIPMEKRSTKAAEYLAQHQWGNTEDNTDEIKREKKHQDQMGW